MTTKYKIYMIITTPKNLLMESSFLDDGSMILTPISSSIFFCVDPLWDKIKIWGNEHFIVAKNI